MKKRSHDWAVILGLVATIITIFVFLTGWQSIWDIFRSLPTSPLSTATVDRNEASIPTARAELVTVSTSTDQPTDSHQQTPESPIDLAVDYPVHSGINLNLVRSQSSGVKISIQIPGGGTPAQKLLADAQFTLWPSIKDITGQWAINRDGGNLKSDITLDQSNVTFVSLSPGNYAIEDDGFYGLLGCTTPFMPNGGIDSIPFIPFPIQNGYETDIVFTPARLDVGVLSLSGNAQNGVSIGVDCQGSDISGKPIAYNPACSNQQCAISVGFGITDSSGLATIFMAPGTYMIRMDTGTGWGNNYIQSGIELTPGDIKRIILTENQ